MSERHKQAYREEAARLRPTIINRPGETGVVTMMKWAFPEPAKWPVHLPPFQSDAVIRFDPDGNLWVERTTASPDAPPEYDVIANNGTVLRTVLLPTRARVIGFGRNSVFVARRDEVDLEYLERYLRPTTRAERRNDGDRRRDPERGHKATAGSSIG